MIKELVLLIILGMMLQACGQNTSQSKLTSTTNEQTIEVQKVNVEGTAVAERFNVPEGFIRTLIDSTSFSMYLRSLQLKPHGAQVLFYNGQTKRNNQVYDAVVDLPIGKRDLHQCADAVMRLRADYLFKKKAYDSISFHFTNGFKADYTNWRKGKRIIVNGNHVIWKQQSQPSDSDKTFWKYLEMVFSYAGTASLSKELKPVTIEEMCIGDVFIKGGFPGHAVIVVDMAFHKTTNEKIFLLAQSYMPAQEIQILKNPDDIELSPWYSNKIGSELRTPEWTFKKTDL